MPTNGMIGPKKEPAATLTTRNRVFVENKVTVRSRIRVFFSKKGRLQQRSQNRNMFFIKKNAGGNVQ